MESEVYLLQRFEVQACVRHTMVSPEAREKKGRVILTRPCILSEDASVNSPRGSLLVAEPLTHDLLGPERGEGPNLNTTFDPQTSSVLHGSALHDRSSAATLRY